MIAISVYPLLDEQTSPLYEGEIGFKVQDLLFYEVQRDEKDEEDIFIATFKNGATRQLVITKQQFDIIRKHFEK